MDLSLDPHVKKTRCVPVTTLRQIGQFTLRRMISVEQLVQKPAWKQGCSATKSPPSERQMQQVVRPFGRTERRRRGGGPISSISISPCGPLSRLIFSTASTAALRTAFMLAVSAVYSRRIGSSGAILDTLWLGMHPPCQPPPRPFSTPYGVSPRLGWFSHVDFGVVVLTGVALTGHGQFASWTSHSILT